MMSPTRGPEPWQVTDEDDRAAARALDRWIRPSEQLAPHIPGEPWGMEAARAATRVARGLLAELGEIYGVQSWDAQAFRELYLDRALAAWRPGSTVEHGAGQERVQAYGCPLAASARRDPRGCHFCQLVHQAVARACRPGEIEDVHFDTLITKGSPVCTFRIVSKQRSVDRA